MLSRVPILVSVQRTGGEPLTWALVSVKSEGPLHTQQSPLQGLLPSSAPPRVLARKISAGVGGSQTSDHGEGLLGRAQGPLWKRSCFCNRSPFTPFSCHSLLPAVRGLNLGASSWLGQLPVQPCSPFSCACSLEARTPPPSTHAHSLLVPFLEVITWGLAVISSGLSQQGTNQGNGKIVLNYTQKCFLQQVINPVN